MNDGHFLFVWFDSLRPINNLLVIKGRVFLGWTSTKLSSMFLLKDTTQWRRWGSNPQPLGLESSTLPLSHTISHVMELIKTDDKAFSWIQHHSIPPSLGTPSRQSQSQSANLNKTVTVKPVLSRHPKRWPKMGFKTDYPLMQVKSIAECSKGSILIYFLPSLSYQLSLRFLLCLFLNGRLRQVLLYCQNIRVTLEKDIYQVFSPSPTYNIPM